MENQPIDKSIVNLMSAVKTHESSGNYNQAPETAGTSLGGAYMYQAPTWKAYAKESMGDENLPFTPENQDKVTYTMMKKWKDLELPPDQIIHKWNPGDPTYVDKIWSVVVKQAKEAGVQQPQISAAPGAQQPTIQTFEDYLKQNPSLETNQSQESLGSQLGGRIQDASSGISTIFKGTGHGTGLLSGTLQTVGAVAGGLGDVINKGIELIPGVKALEGVIGKGISNLAQTDSGKIIMKSIQDFSTAHPELSKDIGAGFNILTAIPILKGIGTITKVGLDAGSIALNEVAEKTFAKEVTSVVGKNSTQVAKDLIEKGIIPDIKNGVYNIIDSMKKLNELRQTITLDSDMIRTDRMKEALQALSNKPVTTSKLGNVVKKITNVGASKLIGGNLVGDYIGNKIEGMTTGILKRTTKGASRVGLKQGSKKIGGLLLGAVSQKANSSN